MANKAKQLPSGSWRCNVYDYTDENGKRIYKSFVSKDSKKGKAKAELMAAEFVLNKNKQIRVQEKTFEDKMQQYIEKKEMVLSPSTIKGYSNIQRMLLQNYPRFCSMITSDITNDDVQNVINSLVKSKSPKTVKNYYGLITAVIGKEALLDTTLPQQVKPDLYIPTDEEIITLINAVKNTELEIPVLLGAFCLMRRGEICALKLSDIKGNVIHIKHSMVLGKDKMWYIKQPKTNSSDRFVEAPQFVVDRIKEVGHITNLNPHSLSIMFQRVLKRNDIKHFRFHDLRHYSASVRHALGIPDAYIMADGGWSTDNVLKAVYRHAMSDRRQSMSAKANSHFESLCKGQS